MKSHKATYKRMTPTEWEKVKTVIDSTGKKDSEIARFMERSSQVVRFVRMTHSFSEYERCVRAYWNKYEKPQKIEIPGMYGNGAGPGAQGEAGGAILISKPEQLKLEDAPKPEKAEIPTNGALWAIVKMLKKIETNLEHIASPNGGHS